MNIKAALSWLWMCLVVGVLAYEITEFVAFLAAILSSLFSAAYLVDYYFGIPRDSKWPPPPPGKYLNHA